MALQPTGFCWKCGRQVNSKLLFCNDKHKNQFERGQDAQIKKGKKAGYGAAGSTH